MSTPDQQEGQPPVLMPPDVPIAPLVMQGAGIGVVMRPMGDRGGVVPVLRIMAVGGVAEAHIALSDEVRVALIAALSGSTPPPANTPRLHVPGPGEVPNLRRRP